MKLLRVGGALLTTGLLVLAYTSTPAAFHSGGVAECVGCHSMHNATSPTFLLVNSDPSSTCLSCHQGANDTGPSSYHISTADAKLSGTGVPLQRTPGGDFGWVKKSYTYSYSGNTYTEEGSTHGHNIVAADFGYLADSHNTTSPGGAFASNKLSCTSCHDPHGQFRRRADGSVATTGGAIWASGSYPGNEPKTFTTTGEPLSVGAYRLLAGNGYTKAPFTGVPAAKVPSSYNLSEATNQVRVAYGNSIASGHASWGRWCGTCHGEMHSTGSSKIVHPVDQNLGSAVATNYNAYVKSGDMTGSATSSFTSLVPFVQNTGDYTALAANAVNNGSRLQGPATNDQVTCLSCHRAHASGMMYGLRYDMEYEFMTKEGQYIGSDNPAITGSRAGAQHRGRLNADWQAAYYDRPASQFSAYQRVLCNKCHQKD